jgi:hypothetical protein
MIPHVILSWTPSINHCLCSHRLVSSTFSSNHTSLLLSHDTQYQPLSSASFASNGVESTDSFGVRVGVAMNATPFGPRDLFQSPSAIAISSIGYIFVSDAATNLIHMLSPTGEASLFAGSGFCSGNDGIGRMASFATPVALCMDYNDNVYVAQVAPGLASIRKITPQGQVTTIAGSSVVDNNEDGPPRVRHRDGIARMKNELGDLVEAAHISASLKQLTTSADDLKFESDRTWSSTMAASKAAVTSTASTIAAFGTCGGVAVDGNGDIYVADTDTRTIRHINVVTNLVQTIAGPKFGDAEPDFADDDDDGLKARFRSPVHTPTYIYEYRM